jgi:hypothetical protein
MSSSVRLMLGSMWLVIGVSAVVRLLTGSERWGIVALLASAVAVALLSSIPTRRTSAPTRWPAPGSS